MVSKNEEKSEIGVSIKSDSHHANVSIEGTSTASTSLSTIDDNQPNEILVEEISSTSKEEVAAKQEDSEVFKKDPLPLQNIDSDLLHSICQVYLAMKSCKSVTKEVASVVSSSNELSSPKSQGKKVPQPYLAFDLAATELEETYKEDESNICMADASNGQDLDNATALTSQFNSEESHLPKTPSEESLSAVQEIKSTFNIEDNKSHRDSKHYSSDSETESSSDSSDEEFFNNLRKGNEVPTAQCPVNGPVKTKGELLIQDLPPVEDLQISASPSELLKIGYVLHLIIAEERMEFFVVVESDGKTKALEHDSVLFFSSGEPFGKIYEVIGRTDKPIYTVRFNKAEDIFNKGVTKGQDVFFAPKNPEFTRYIFIEALKNQKGSDASWKDNNEPPEEEIDYSDDEQEKLAKQKRRAKTRGKERDWDDGEEEDVAPKKMERKDATFKLRDFKRASRNMFRSTPSGPSRSSSGSCSPQRFGSAPPPSDNFGSSGQPRNSISPQQFWPPSMNSNPFLPRNRPSSVPLGQFEHSNLPSPKPCESLPLSNVPAIQRFGQFPHSHAPAPQPFGQLPSSNVPPQQSNGYFPQGQSSMSFQPFSGPSAPNQASYLATSAPQLNPTSLMAAPQSNVPLHQQLLLQSQQLVNTVPSNPPPSFNSNQNSRNFLRPHQFFTHAAFGAPPAARSTMQNISNQLPINPLFFPSGTNGAHFGLAGNLNISQSTNIAPLNSNSHQGQSYGMLQSNLVNSSIFPHVQQNNMHPPSTELLAAMHQFGTIQTPPPRPNNPFVPPQSPPVLLNQQGLSVMSNAHPQVFPNQSPHPPISRQTPSPFSNQQNLSNFSNAYPQVLPNQNTPSTVYFHTSPAPEGPTYGQNYRPF